MMLLTTVPAASSSGSSGAAQAVASFKDTFKTLNRSSWYIADGWSDGTWMLNDWRKGQLSTGAQGLTITLAKNAAAVRGYSSGQIQSPGTAKYGYWETKMQAAKGSGLDSSFFLYTASPVWNEIDVEILGRNTRQLQATYHIGKQEVGTIINLPFDASTGQHRYGFDWQPGWIRWYVDGQMVYQETGTKLPLPTEQQKLYLSMWSVDASGPISWIGPPDTSIMPVRAVYGCVAESPTYKGPLC